MLKKIFIILFLLFFPTLLFANWNVYEETSINGTTNTVSSGTIIKTFSGNIYEITSGYAYEYEYNPNLLVLNNGNRYRLIIEGFDEEFSASCLNCSGGNSLWNVYEETSVNGTTNTISYGTIIKTFSGHIYEVIYGIGLSIEINPNILILNNGNSYQLIIDGYDEKFLSNCLNCSGSLTNLNLDKNYSSDDIKLLQWGLTSLGFGNLVRDGDYGAATKKAVADFGGKYGIGENLSKKHWGYISIILKQQFPNNDDVKNAADRLFKISYFGGSLNKQNNENIVVGETSGDCYDTSIKAPNPYQGNGGETIVLNDGTIWTEHSYQYLYLYEYYPMVTVCPSRGVMLLGDNKFDIQRSN
jgi:hypothetical protein